MAHLFETIRREAPVQAYTGTVVEKSQANEDAIIRLSGGASLKARTAMSAGDVGYGQEVLVLRFPQSSKPIIISGLAGPSIASSAGAGGTQENQAFAPDNFSVSAGVYSVIAVWDCPYSYSDYAFLVQTSNTGGESDAEQVLVTKGSSYTWYGPAETEKYIRVASIKAKQDGLIRSGWTPWANATSLHPLELQVQPEEGHGRVEEVFTLIAGDTLLSELQLDNQDAASVWAGPVLGTATSYPPNFRLLNFIELGDTPNTYSGSDQLYVRVNIGDEENPPRLEFAPVPTGGGDGGGGQYAVGGNSLITARWHSDGRLVTCTEFDGVWWAVDRMVALEVIMYCETLGTAGSTVVDIESSTDGSSWSSIFTNPGDRPSLAWNDSDKQATAEPDIQLDQDAMLRANIVSVATGARNLSVQLLLTRENVRNLLPLIGVAHYV